MYFTYIIQSTKTNRFYIGSTGNITERIQQHNNGVTKSTRNHGPYVLVHLETYETRGEAVKREKAIKRYKHGNAFKKLIGINCQDAGAVNRNSL